jgi:spore maturation protein SpmA
MTRTFALVIGVIFLVIGILGFASPPDHELLLGIFAVNDLHNVVHVAVGLAGILAGWLGWSRLYCKALGVAYLLVGILGFVPGAMDSRDMLFGLIHLNLADNILHLVVGAVAAYLGFASQYSRLSVGNVVR